MFFFFSSGSIDISFSKFQQSLISFAHNLTKQNIANHFENEKRIKKIIDIIAHVEEQQTTTTITTTRTTKKKNGLTKIKSKKGEKWRIGT